MGFKKPDIELANYLEEQLFDYNVSKRRMFSCPCYFLNGNMVGGVFEDTIFLRLSPEDREDLKDESDEVINFEPIEGRPMKEYLIIPDSIYNQPDFISLLDKSIDFVRSLPPK